MRRGLKVTGFLSFRPVRQRMILELRLLGSKAGTLPVAELVGRELHDHLGVEGPTERFQACLESLSDGP